MASSDLDKVARAAAHLDIAEVTLFREAYRNWYGRCVDETVLERHFVRFMFASVVPHWVREYAREVLNDARHQRLDPRRFGIRPRRGRQLRLGLCMLLLPMAVFGVLVVIAHGSLDFIPGISGCMLPPCY